MTHPGFRRLSAVIATLALVLAAPAGAAAKGSSSSSSSSSSRSSSSSSSSSKPSTSTGSKTSGGAKYANGTSRPARPTLAKPSTGSRPQTAPVTRLVPPQPPGRLASGAAAGLPLFRGFTSGRYDRDRRFLYGHPRYADPYYGRRYYGYHSSPFFYLWLGSVLDDDSHNNPRPPSSDTEVSPAVLSWMRAIEAQQQLATAK